MTATVAPALEADRPGLAERIDRHSGPMMVLPAVIVLLCFAIFPLIISAYLSLSRFALAQGGFTLKFIGVLNYKKLLTGSQQYHLLGTFGPLGAVSWIVLAAGLALVLLWFVRYFLRGRATVPGTPPGAKVSTVIQRRKSPVAAVMSRPTVPTTVARPRRK